MKKIILYFLLIILFVSCEDEIKTTIVKGYIREARSERPIQGAGLSLHHQPILKRQVFLEHFAEVSDSSGYFEISFEGDKASGYYIVPGKNGYSCVGSCLIYLNSGAVNELTIELKPHVQFTLAIQNEPPALESDSIFFCLDGEYISDAKRDCWYCLGDCNENVFSNWTLQSNGIINLTWWVTENGITTPYSHDIELVSLDTVEYTIRY
jgi:hypothetical protein